MASNVKSNFFEDNQDIQFQLKKNLDFAELFALTTEQDRELLGASTPKEYLDNWCEFLSSIGACVGTEVAPMSKKLSKLDLKLDPEGNVIFPEAYLEVEHKLKEFSLSNVGIPFSYGGIEVPLVIEFSIMEMVYRAFPSVALNLSWYGTIARIIDEFGSDALKQEFIPPLASGQWSGSMALTEADAGSDLANLKTFGEEQPDGTWRLYGSKRFITNGSGQVCLVLARSSKESKGLGGLNLYLCPRILDGAANFFVTKLEDKVGLHLSPTCELKFDGSKAYLIGERNHGFSYMLHLMNEARVGVAFQALAIMEASYRLIEKYASERSTWGKPLAHHELVAEKLLDLRTEISALRSLTYESAFAVSFVQMAEYRLKKSPALSTTEEETLRSTMKKYKLRIRRWTPLIKYWAGERVFVHARTALQLHGGYGFTKEYHAEWWLRESLIISIYEGTSQIQALMCLKDTLKEIMRRPQAFVEVALGTRLKMISERDPLRRKLGKMRQLFNNAVLAVLMGLVRENLRVSFSHVKLSDILNVIRITGKEFMKFESLSSALVHAERICEMKALVCLSESLLRNLKRDPHKRDSQREATANHFLSKALPRMQMLRAEIDLDTETLRGDLQEKGRWQTYNAPSAKMPHRDPPSSAPN